MKPIFVVDGRCEGPLRRAVKEGRVGGPSFLTVKVSGRTTLQCFDTKYFKFFLGQQECRRSYDAEL